MVQPSLFADHEGHPRPKPTGDRPERLRVVVTVKGAPVPSAKYGETVCVAGLRIDPDSTGWVRLYPLHFRELTAEAQFHKYDVVSFDAIPARQDARSESWKPSWESIEFHGHLDPWKDRRRWLDEYREGSLCRIVEEARADVRAKSLALIAPSEILGFETERHPGWTAEQRRKLEGYLAQRSLFGTEQSIPPELEPPRFKGFYRYRCHESGCNGHRQQLLDWELVAFQRRMHRCGDAELRRRMREQFLDRLCAPDREVAFFVGNMARHRHVFSALGVYWPPAARVPRQRSGQREPRG